MASLPHLRPAARNQVNDKITHLTGQKRIGQMCAATEGLGNGIIADGQQQMPDRPAEGSIGRGRVAYHSPAAWPKK